MRHLFLLLCFFTLSCASWNTASQPTFKLKSISDILPPDKTEKKTVFAYILLKTGEPNTVAVFNFEVYELFAIYRLTLPDSIYRPHGTLRAGKKPHVSALLTSFLDVQNSSLQDRYKVVPIVNNVELQQLPMIYETLDQTYYQQIEGITNR